VSARVIGDLLPPIETVVRVRPFSVSSLVHADVCLLRTVRASAQPIEGLLSPGISATLGRISHRILEESAKGVLTLGQSPRNSVISRLQELLVAEGMLEVQREESVAQIVRTLGMSPRDGHRFLARITNGAVNVHAIYPKSIGKRRSTRSFEHSTRRHLRPGTEVPLHNDELDLKGRIDRLDRVAEGSWLITDFKTYTLPEHPSSLPAGVRIQLELYALLVRQFEPDSRIMAKAVGIDGSSRTVEITEAALQERYRWLSDLAAKVPLDTVTQTASLTSPGPDCKGCNLRPRCRAYARAAQEAWAASSLSERWPFDLWGTLLRFESGNGPLTTIRVRDRADRECRIEGLRQEDLTEKLHPGDLISLFDHGAYFPAATTSRIRHPRNFFETPSQPHMRPAPNAAIFAGCPSVI